VELFRRISVITLEQFDVSDHIQHGNTYGGGACLRSQPRPASQRDVVPALPNFGGSPTCAYNY